MHCVIFYPYRDITPCLLLHIHSSETTEVNISCDLCGIKLHVTKASALKAIYPIAFSFFL